MSKLRAPAKRKPHHLPNITDSFVDDVRRPTGKLPDWHWDKSRTGFGVKIYPPSKNPNRKSGRVYVQRVTVEGNKKKVFFIGPQGNPWNAKDAREEARLIRQNIRQGLPHDAHHRDRKAALYQLKDLANAFFEYFEEQVAQGNKEAKTLKKYRKQWENNVPKALKATPVGSLKKSLFQSALATISGLNSKKPRPVEGNRTIDMLSAILGWVMDQDPEDRMGLKENHCLAVKRNQERESIGIWMEDDEQERLLSFLLNPSNRREVWYATERQARIEAKGQRPRRIPLKQPPYLITNQVAWALLLLFLSGMRSWEVKGLKWSTIHARTQRLKVKQTKRGANPGMTEESKTIFISVEVQEILDQIPKKGDWVFPSDGRSKKPKSGHLENLQDPWERVRKHLNLPKIRLHDYRHTAASEAGDDRDVSQTDLKEGYGWKTDSTALRYMHSRRKSRDQRLQNVVTNRINRILGDRNTEIQDSAATSQSEQTTSQKSKPERRNNNLEDLRLDRLTRPSIDESKNNRKT